jgi:hypothetical protein
MMLCCRSVGLCLSAQPNKTLSTTLAQTPVNQMKCESFFFSLSGSSDKEEFVALAA